MKRVPDLISARPSPRKRGSGAPRRRIRAVLDPAGIGSKSWLVGNSSAKGRHRISRDFVGPEAYAWNASHNSARLCLGIGYRIAADEAGGTAADGRRRCQDRQQSANVANCGLNRRDFNTRHYTDLSHDVHLCTGNHVTDQH